MRSRWAVLVAPLAYLAAYELGRIGIAGASLDGFRPDNVYGILARVVGRGFHGLLALFPMAVGAGIGVVLARPPRRARSLIPSGVLSLAVVGLAILVALPGSTPPVLGVDGQPVPGSIAELTTVELGGQEQSILVRASDPDDPVLLYLSGGPGQSDPRRWPGAPRATGRRLRGGRLGPARHGHVVRSDRPHRGTHARAGGSGHDPAERAACRPLRRGAHLPAWRVAGSTLGVLLLRSA